ncbi:sodium channel modifier 1 isoform X3 [Heterodontus francisci]|uniref:sodium channel modifier 1 isoform X3 n=1 Tax=Heterodontus francisci TaxID=7792 RepID=UPI00355C58BA
MAFKREGDDLSQLNALRKRRVADLLASYIPEDEAILMKNGRYACSVCYNRPVFDTVDMLAVHRTGKRHVAGLQRFYRNKWSLRLEIQKRRHQQHVREEEEEAGAGGQQTGTELAPLLSQTRRITHHALLKAAPYNSCCKRTRPGGEGPSPSPGCGDAAATEAGGGPELPRSAGGASITDAQPTASLPAGKGTQPENIGPLCSISPRRFPRGGGARQEEAQGEGSSCLAVVCRGPGETEAGGALPDAQELWVDSGQLWAMDAR